MQLFLLVSEVLLNCFCPICVIFLSYFDTILSYPQFFSGIYSSFSNFYSLWSDWSDLSHLLPIWLPELLFHVFRVLPLRSFSPRSSEFVKVLAMNFTGSGLFVSLAYPALALLLCIKQVLNMFQSLFC